jgi:uncharacterized protein (TIGR02147 family)
MFDIYTYGDYKAAIRDKLKETKKIVPTLTMKKVASRMGLQYTYLSALMTKDTQDLSEDQIFEFGQILEVSPDEIEFLVLLRNLRRCQRPTYREFLVKKIENIRAQKKINVPYNRLNVDTLSEQIAFLSQPLCPLVLTSLDIKEFREDPRKLMLKLQLTEREFRKILAILQSNGYLSLAADGLHIDKIHGNRNHFGREHPLTRTAQLLNKQVYLSKLRHTPENEKDSQWFLFTMDMQGFEKVRNLYLEFLRAVQSVSMQAKEENLFYLSFDLMKVM